MRARFVILFIFVFIGTKVHAEQFTLDPVKNVDTVYFRSTAQLEFIEGKTNTLTGSITFDPANTASGASGALKCDLSTLRTGIATRDGHMRDKYLHTDKFPDAYFELQTVSGLPSVLKTDTLYNASAAGYFYIHGVKRQIKAALTVSLHKHAESLALSTRAKFTIKLDDFKIERPKALFLKLAETIEVEVVFTGLNDISFLPVALPEWPELK